MLKVTAAFIGQLRWLCSKNNKVIYIIAFVLKLSADMLKLHYDRVQFVDDVLIKLYLRIVVSIWSFGRTVGRGMVPTVLTAPTEIHSINTNNTL